VLDIGHGLALDAHLHVVPIRSGAQRVSRRVPAVTRERRQVHAADEGDLPIDDDGLLVVAVREVGAGVELAL